MPISHKYNAIFVHIPKTAGTSIENVLEISGIMPDNLRSHSIKNIDGVNFAPQHYTSLILKEHSLVKEFWNSYFKFSVVRNPYSRVLSEWFWVRTEKGEIIEDTETELDIKKFKIHLHDFYKKLDTDHKLLQSDYIYKNNKCLVDKVFKFENLIEVNEVLKEKCKVKKNLPHIQKSSNKNNYIEQLTQSHKDFIYELYKEDFKNFNYKR